MRCDPTNGIPRLSLDGLRRSRSGSVAVEFALIAPFMILLLLGAFDLSRYINAQRRITLASNSIAEILAQNGSGKITYKDIFAALDSTMITFPAVLSDAKAKGMNWWGDVHVNMSSVLFTPTVPACTSNCTYTAKTAWSYGANKRPCATQLTAAPDTNPPSPTSLPTSLFGPGSAIVVDIKYNYTPLVATKIFGTLPISKSFYIPPRYVPKVDYEFIWGDPLLVTPCPS